MIGELDTVRPATSPAEAPALRKRSGSHLKPALLALLMICSGVIAAYWYADRLEHRYLDTLAPRRLSQKNQGVALQRAAFQRSDLLPIYGSSELYAPDPGSGIDIFKEYPDGFTLFPVGDQGSTSLVFLQKLAAIGPGLRGKKVAISIAPSQYLDRQAHADYYAGNFSRLQAGELVWSTNLSFAVKQAAAKRMLQYPDTLKDDPILTFGLERLADGSMLNHVVYVGVLPLGKLENLITRLQDQWQMLSYITRHPHLDVTVSHRPQALDWASLIAAGDQKAKEKVTNNPFGIPDQRWTEYWSKLDRPKNSLTDRGFQDLLQNSQEWRDLDILLAVLRELGAKPLILSSPVHKSYFEYLGVACTGRRAYHERIRAVAQHYGVRLADFADHDADPYFLADPDGHLSAKGWAYYAQVLDAFYHSDGSANQQADMSTLPPLETCGNNR